MTLVTQDIVIGVDAPAVVTLDVIGDNGCEGIAYWTRGARNFSIVLHEFWGFIYTKNFQVVDMRTKESISNKEFYLEDAELQSIKSRFKELISGF